MSVEIDSYDIGKTLNGKPEASEVLLRIPFARDVWYPTDMEGSEGIVAVAPTSQADFIIKRNDELFAIMTFAASATTATFTSYFLESQSFLSGDVLTVEAPASQDATLSDLGFLLKGTKI